MPDDDKTKPKDPWHNGHDTSVVHVRTCYNEGCGAVHGCLVLIGKRVVTFDGECHDCEHEGKPSCYARSSVRLVEQPAMCPTCSLKIS